MNAGAIPHSWIRYAITAAVVAVVMAIRFRRAGVARPLKLGQLLIIPAVYGVLAIVMFVSAPPTRTGWLLCATALAVGAAAGWQRGRMIRIDVDPETRTLQATQSPFAILFILVLILVRSGLRVALQSKAGGVLDAATLTDMLIAFALGLLAVQRIEMYLRARRLLAAAPA
ncbi:MAG: CcdC protein domain-containing protein [Allosphingosinicella sp.]